MVLASTTKPMSEQMRQATLRAYLESFGHGPQSSTEQQMIDFLERLGYRVLAPAKESAKAA
jgi:hypothetical protein